MAKHRTATAYADRVDEPVAQSHLTLDEKIRQRAYELYVARGEQVGSDLEDWLQAEREVLGDSGKDPAQDRATTVGKAGRPGVVL